MKNLAELRENLEKTEIKLATRTGEFVGEIGDFQYFIKQAISKQFHFMATNGHTENKLTLKEIEQILFNISMLDEIFGLIGKKDAIENQLYQDFKEA